MIDFQMTETGDLRMDEFGEIFTTESVVQEAMIKLKWFLGEWRLGTVYGFPYFQEVFVKNPNLSKIKHYVRETLLGIEAVTTVLSVDLSVNKVQRTAVLFVSFAVGEEIYHQEVALHE